MTVDLVKLRKILEAEMSAGKLAEETGKDIITCATAILLDKHPNDVTPEERNIIKALSFPILYGRE